MFGKSFKLFRLFGFEVNVDLSWLVIAVLVAWSLAAGLFPAQVKGLSSATYWYMGIAGAIGLFASVIFHELWHSLIARRFGLEMKGITLFIFGGVSEMAEEPSGPKVEFWMAVAGPLSSLFLGGAFYGIYLLTRTALSPEPVSVTAVLFYLGYINGLLAVFNLIPAFPLDGGRLLRSALWGGKRDLLWATRIASSVGNAFGILMVVVGVGGVFFGRLDFISGIWFFLIGMFLSNAARSSYQQLLLRKGLEGLKVSRFMEANPITVSRALSIEHLVEDYIYKHAFKMYPVVDDGRLVGCVTIQKIKDIPRSEWAIRTVGEVSGGCSADNSIAPNTDAMEALAQMNRGRLSRLMVVEGDKLVGIITLKDMLKFLSIKLELGDAART